MLSDTTNIYTLLFLSLLFALAACTPTPAEPYLAPHTPISPSPSPTVGLPPTPTHLPTVIAPNIPLFNENIPGYYPSHRRDSIRPVYNPRFANAQDIDLPELEFVIGVAWEGEAKAYPIGVMRFREMVNDELAGIPILVTW